MAEDLEAIPSSLSVQYPTTKELQSRLREIFEKDETRASVFDSLGHT
jgi:hypothetical protein